MNQNPEQLARDEIDKQLLACDYIIDVRKKYDQVIDDINIDEIINIGWVADQQAAAALTISNFTA